MASESRAHTAAGVGRPGFQPLVCGHCAVQLWASHLFLRTAVFPHPSHRHRRDLPGGHSAIEVHGYLRPHGCKTRGKPHLCGKSGKINDQVDPWGWSVIYSPSFSPRLALISFSERLAGSVGLVTAGCQNPQSHALTDRCSHTHPRPPGLGTLPSTLAWSCECWVHSWHSEDKGTPLPLGLWEGA